DAIASSLYSPQLVHSDSVSCGGPIDLSTLGNYASYLWPDSSTGPSLSVDSSGSYFAKVRDSSGCPAFTDTVDLTVHPLPPEPIVYQQGDSLFTNMTGVTYQWYRDGIPISGATGPGHHIQAQGAFHLVVADSNGCQNSSDTLHAIPSSLEASKTFEASIHPNPVQEGFRIELSARSEGKLSYKLVDIHGRIIRSGSISLGERTEWVNMKESPSGIYLLHWKGKGEKGRKRLIKR
ncbi:MAG: T9SS type A sorting domain-containing protein, partial [Flavobacteriales bacterium]